MSTISEDSKINPSKAESGGGKPEETSEFSLRSVMVLSASCMSIFCTAGLLNAFGVFQTYYSTHFLQHYSQFDISWIGSFAIFMFFGFGPLAGLLFDKFGPKVPLGIGVICQLLAIFMVSLCKEYYQFFLAQGALLGFGMSMITIPTTSVTPLYFQRNRGLAQGVSVAGSSLGGVIWPIMIQQLLSHDRVSFGWTIRIVGFVQLPMLICVFFGIVRPPRSETAKAAIAQSEKDDVSPESKSKDEVENKSRALDILRKPTFTLLCAGLAIFYFGFFSPFFFVSAYGISLGISEDFSIYFISILNAASVFGRILPGLIADRTGHFNTILCAMIGSAIVCFCWKAVDSLAGLVVWSAAYGFISGAVLSLQFACASLVAAKESMGVAIGILMASIALTALFGTPIAGALVKDGYLALSMFSGGIMAVGAILVLGARLARNRKWLARA